MGLDLYEATTDLFYACGIDLDSPKWLTGEWPGQNVMGQVLMKVRGDLLSEESLTDSISLISPLLTPWWGSKLSMRMMTLMDTNAVELNDSSCVCPACVLQRHCETSLCCAES